jgi:hypothetical protein
VEGSTEGIIKNVYSELEKGMKRENGQKQEDGFKRAN